MLECLKRNANGFLYQKCGYLFEELREEFGFSDIFFKECKKHCSSAKKYLMRDEQEMLYNENWKLYTPAVLKKLIDKGVKDYDAIG